MSGFIGGQGPEKQDILEMHCTTHDVAVERFKNDGWFFVTMPDFPGLMCFGPELHETLESAEVALFELLRANGDRIVKVEIDSFPDTDLGWAPAKNLRASAMHQMAA